MTHGHSIARRRFLRQAAAFAAGSGLVASSGRTALAAYPIKPIRILVPQPAAGPTDICARIMAQELGEALKGSTVVENKTGAGGNVGISGFARAEPDGYNLMIVSNVLVVNPAIYQSVTYDPIGDFAPICEIAVAPNCIVVDPKLGINTFAELVSLARKEPGRLNYTTPGLGTAPYLAAESLKKTEKLDMVLLPMTGGGPALQAILAGTVSVLLTSIAPVRPYIQAGQLKPLVVLGPNRWPDWPHVPTWNELGFKGPSYETFQCMVAPAKTPAELVQLLEKNSLAILSRSEVRSKFAAAGFDVTATTGAALGKRIAEEVPEWKQIVSALGIQPR